MMTDYPTMMTYHPTVYRENWKRAENQGIFRTEAFQWRYAFAWVIIVNTHHSNYTAHNHI